MKRGMKNKIKLLLFDFDGTLADTKKRWFYSLMKVLKQEKLFCPECEAKVIIHFGKKIKETLASADISEQRAEKIRNKVYSEFLKKLPKKIYDFSFLSSLKCKKIILSNSPGKIIRKVLGGDIKFFDRVYGEEKFGNKVEFIKKLKNKMKLRGNEVAYIGDRAGDVVTARKSGCVSVIVSNKYIWNSQKEIAKSHPNYLISSLKDLQKLPEK